MTRFWQFIQDEFGHNRNIDSAVSHLRKFLGREPRFNDLTEKNIGDLVGRLRPKLKPATVMRIKNALAAVCRRAEEMGILEAVPKLPIVPQPSDVPAFSVEQLNRLFASAQAHPEGVGEIPGGIWYRALFAVMLDAPVTVNSLLMADREQFNSRQRLLKVDGSHRLDPFTVDLLNRVTGFGSEKLLPWPWDSRRPPFHTLYRKVRGIAFKAGIGSHTRVFQGLRQTRLVDPKVCGRISLDIAFTARSDDLPRPQQSRRLQVNYPRIWRIQPPNQERCLRHFFETSYRRLRLADRSVKSTQKFRSVLNRFSWYLACEPTFENLNDDTVQEFMAWLKVAGRSSATVNSTRACLLALWRHAWRKRYVDELPRDVSRLRLPKSIPVAWSLDEFAQILSAAAELEGSVEGIPAGQWWKALLLTLYDTGLRINALLHARSNDLDVRSRTLMISHEVQKHRADQAFAIHADTLQLILKTNPQKRPLLFPWTSGMRRLRNDYRDIVASVGLPHSRTDLFHKVRRTSATYLVKSTDILTAQRHLGHSSVQVTLSYVDPRLVGGLNAAIVMERPTLGVV